MAAAIVELDPLPDPVRTAAQDHDLLPVARRGFAFGRAEQRGLIGRIHVGRDRLEFGRAAVDPLEHRVDAKLLAQLAHLVLGGRPGHCPQRIVKQARAARGERFAQPAGHADPAHRQDRQALVGKAHGLQPAQPGRIVGQAVFHDRRFLGDNLFDVAQEPGIEVGDRLDFLDREALAEGLGHHQQPIGRLL